MSRLKPHRRRRWSLKETKFDSRERRRRRSTKCKQTVRKKVEKKVR